ncbi:hypothetical protein AUJ69_01705 [Candidatus Woesearchaeota archaeon CG1_02_47_18]|nr:MAG: hypothetical protein AUJ69_01705 [Candidatus Woesearchaeota archaeon CG1_02_47_18]HII30041.1 Ni/Fe hydrogenase subunit alpha [Candidatus Woesearchaeota archaeon]
MESIKLNHITKIEGHASLLLEIDGDELKRCELAAVEGARLFEGIILGKHFLEVAAITSRICGICSCSHTMTSLKAIEKAMGITVSKQTRMLRRLMHLGEMIRSHSTHLYFLALPDYLGFASAISMAQKHKREFERALRLIYLGNEIVELVGGRSMHPVTTRVGGFSRIPEQGKIKKLRSSLARAERDAVATFRLFSRLKYPAFERPSQYCSIVGTGNQLCFDGRMLDTGEYRKYIVEQVHEYSNSKFSFFNGREYMVGAMARYNNRALQLSGDAKKLAKPLPESFSNPFFNNVCQALELVSCVEEAKELLGLKLRNERQRLKPKPGHGVAASEAPRGVLIHDYEFDERGYITAANIIPPTAHQLARMEEDIRNYVALRLSHCSKENLVHEVEKLIRAYDPCFSCSAHFLKVEIKQT